jgi:CubicO group peptidase (beta-lactamase class C family)
MLTRRILALIGLAMFSCAAGRAQVPSDEKIRQILADRITKEDLGIGMVVGVVDASGRRIIAYGSLAKDNSRRVDGDTVFDIGSITKEITSLLLTDMARRGEVRLTDPVSMYLPKGVKMPERNGRKITLADLSTHSSGLPRMPSNFKPKDDSNPYADYTVEQLYEFLSGYQLTRDIGSQYEYSNLAYGLLGHVLALRAGMSYEALVQSRIADPLGMSSTGMTLKPEMRPRFAVGHDRTLAPVPNWDIPTLSGAGALRSTANDMLTFLAANLGLIKTPLAEALANQLSVRRPSDGPGFEVGYGWRIQTKHGSTIVWHGGSTGGYRCYIGFDPKARVGVIILSNIQVPFVDDLGPYLLNQNYELKYPYWTGPPFGGK